MRWSLGCLPRAGFRTQPSNIPIEDSHSPGTRRHHGIAAWGTTMKRVIAVVLTSLTLCACANVGETGPSFLGLGSAFADETDETPAVAQPSTAMRRVKSNKVLSAMAFHRVTGRPVDPSRLTGE